MNVIDALYHIHILLVITVAVFCLRCVTSELPIIDGSTSGIFDNHGPNWRITRRTTLSSLRDFGVGKTSLEDTILEEADGIVRALDENEGRPFNPIPTLSCATINIICSIVFGIR